MEKMGSCPPIPKLTKLNLGPRSLAGLIIHSQFLLAWLGMPGMPIVKPVTSADLSPPGTSPRSATAIERGVFAIAMIYHVGNYSAKNFRSDLTDLYGCLLPRKDVFTYNSLD